jgi:Secretion system C-terminal sorting domain
LSITPEITALSRGKENVTLTQSACTSYIFGSDTLTTSGTYTRSTLDTLYTLNLTIKQRSSSSVTVTNCGAYTWPSNGQTYSQSGTYTAVFNNAVGCDSTVTLNLTVNQLPITGSISGANAVCIGGAINLTPSTTGGTWSTSALTIATVTNGTVRGIVAGTATISYKIGTGNCASTFTKLITVEAAPVVTLSGSYKICTGGRAMMKASVSGGVWGVENSALIVTSSQGLFRNPTKPATDNFKTGINYTLKSKLGACTTKAVKLVIVRNVTAPSITITDPKTSLKVNEIVTATATTTIVANGTWTSMNTFVSATRNIFNAKIAAIRGLGVGTNANIIYYADDAVTGCRPLNWLTFSVTAASSIVDVASSHTSQTDGVHIYPNPSNGRFTIENTDGATSVKLVDLSGRVVATQPINAGTSTIDFSGVATGKYMVHVTGESINEVQSVVIE